MLIDSPRRTTPSWASGLQMLPRGRRLHLVLAGQAPVAFPEEATAGSSYQPPQPPVATKPSPALGPRGHLHYADTPGQSPFKQLDITYVSGHTDRMMIPRIRYKDQTICFMADLLPSVGHIPLPYVMGYDTRPLLTLEEKEAFLNEAADRQYIERF